MNVKMKIIMKDISLLFLETWMGWQYCPKWKYGTEKEETLRILLRFDVILAEHKGPSD